MTFTLNTLKDVPRVTKQNAFFTSVDDKSGFDHGLLEKASTTLFVFSGLLIFAGLELFLLGSNSQAIFITY